MSFTSFTADGYKRDVDWSPTSCASLALLRAAKLKPLRRNDNEAQSELGENTTCNDINPKVCYSKFDQRVHHHWGMENYDVSALLRFAVSMNSAAKLGLTILSPLLSPSKHYENKRSLVPS